MYFCAAAEIRLSSITLFAITNVTLGVPRCVTSEKFLLFEATAVA